MKPPPTPPAPGSVKDMQQRKGPQPTLPPPLTEEEEAQLAGGFHESSYELRTGVDILESDWPDDVDDPRRARRELEPHGRAVLPITNRSTTRQSVVGATRSVPSISTSRPAGARRMRRKPL